MTKDDFRKLAIDAMETVLTMPDDLWEGGYPMLRVRYKGSNEVVIVGVEEVGGDEDRDSDN